MGGRIRQRLTGRPDGSYVCPLTAAQRERETELLVLLDAPDEQIGKLAGRPRPTPDDERRLEQLYRNRYMQQGIYIEFEQLAGSSLRRVRWPPCESGAGAGGADRRHSATGMGPPERRGERDLSPLGLPGAPRGRTGLGRRPGTGPNGAWVSADKRQAGELRAALVSREAGWRQLAVTVAAQRLGPLRANLEGIRRLVVLPSPGLAGVPVEVLAEAWTEAPRDVVVSYAPSATIFERLARPRTDASAPPRLLALGDRLTPRTHRRPHLHRRRVSDLRCNPSSSTATLATRGADRRRALDIRRPTPELPCRFDPATGRQPRQAGQDLAVARRRRPHAGVGCRTLGRASGRRPASRRSGAGKAVGRRPAEPPDARPGPAAAAGDASRGRGDRRASPQGADHGPSGGGGER